VNRSAWHAASMGSSCSPPAARGSAPLPTPDHDAPAPAARRARRRHRDPGTGDPVPAPQAQRAVCQAHRQNRRIDRKDMDRDRFMSRKSQRVRLIDTSSRTSRKSGRRKQRSDPLRRSKPLPILGYDVSRQASPLLVCGKSKDSSGNSSPASVYICNECIALCNEILAEDEERKSLRHHAGPRLQSRCVDQY